MASPVLQGLIFFICFLAAFYSVYSTETPSAEFIVDQETGRIKDRHGRERIFHGLNVVVKGPPWHPITDHFDSRMSLSIEDISLLKSLGLNVVRLGVMWPGVEPQRGVVNETYIEVMKGIVQRLYDAGIYSLVEMHQDVFGKRFCGEGMPAWILDDRAQDSQLQQQQQLLQLRQRQVQVEKKNATVNRENIMISILDRSQGQLSSNGGSSTVARKLLSEGNSAKDDRPLEADRVSTEISSNDRVKWNMPCFVAGACRKPSEYSVTFPEPLARRYTGDTVLIEMEPSPQQCWSHDWGKYHFTFAVGRAFQDLYDNKWGWMDAMAQYWAVVARSFKEQPGILGYELINEPWVGDQYTDPLLLLPGVADWKNLLPFYDQLQAAIRKEDASHLLFFESVTFDNLLNGFSRVPGGGEYANMSVLAYHYYRPPNFGVEQTFAERTKESKRLRCGSFLTEFGIPSKSVSASSTYGHPDLAEAASFVRDALQATVPEKISESYIQQVTESETEEGTNVREDSEVGSIGLGKDCKEEVRKSSTETTPFLISESRRGSLNEPEAEEVMETADVHVQSWIGWEFKPFINKTGVNLGPFNSDGTVDIFVARALARTYPQAVAGNIVSFSFDQTTSIFSLSYVAAPVRGDGILGDLSATTEIWFHRDYFYPSGLEISVEPSLVEVEEESNMIFLRHGADVEGLQVQLTIRRKPDTA